jgi:hypothetical protein
MKKCSCIIGIMLIVGVILIISVSTEAYFKDIGSGVRPMGMGGAYTALADDGNSPMWNSAGLAQIKEDELAFAYSALYVGLDPKLYNSDNDQLGSHLVSYIHPLKSGSVGFCWNTFQSNIYDENVICLSYGRKLIGSLYIGINLKRMGWNIATNEYTKIDDDIPDYGVSKNGFTIDMGFLLKPNSNFSLGFSAENLIPADVGLNIKETISLNLRSGIAYKVNTPKDLDIKILTLLDTYYRKQDRTMDVRMGIEGWFLQETVGIRTGINSTSLTSGISYCLSLSELKIQLDYAFIYSFSIADNYGSHRVALALRF